MVEIIAGGTDKFLRSSVRDVARPGEGVSGVQLVGARRYPGDRLESGRLFGYLARRLGNRATTDGAPGVELARAACKWWWTPEGGVAGNGEK